MPLQNLVDLHQEYRINEVNAADHQSIELNHDFRAAFSALYEEKGYDVNYTSGCTILSRQGDYRIVPNLYFALALGIYEFGLAAKSYADLISDLSHSDLFDHADFFSQQALREIVLEQYSLAELQQICQNQNIEGFNNFSNAFQNCIEEGDREQMLRVFFSSEARLNAKRPFDNGGLRGDFLGAVIGKVVGVVNFNKHGDVLPVILIEMITYDSDLAEGQESIIGLLRNSLNAIEKQTLIPEIHNLNKFAKALFEYLNNNYQEHLFAETEEQASTHGGTEYNVLRVGPFSKLFLVSDAALTREDNESVFRRYDPELIFERNGSYYYISNQWSSTRSGNAYNRDLPSLRVFLSEFSDPMFIHKKGSDYELLNYNPGLPYSYQRIFYGAAGTGKSYSLNNEAKSVFEEDEIKRITFYPEYSYGRFVGAYKPIPIRVKSEDVREFKRADGTVIGNDDKYEVIIDYQFEPGPFLDIFIEATNNRDRNYLLIIEEINRAQVSEVFGEVFQLLDRNDEGYSEYPVTLDADSMNFLNDYHEMGENIVLPPNLYIWATMNSSDQGVYPMDTAFKRRWSFKYLDIDSGSAKIVNSLFRLRSGQYVYWDLLRKAINKKIISTGMPEDKLLGPFFISPDELENLSIVSNKLILYLKEDVYKYNPGEFFTISNNDYSFSNLVDKFQNNILELFAFADNKIIYTPEEEVDDGDLEEEDIVENQGED